MNTPLFTLHRIFTLYHYEIFDKKTKVNSVNSKTKKLLSPLHRLTGRSGTSKTNKGEESTDHPSPTHHHLTL
ncbi:hypothetical protein ACVXG7_03265 [Enterobacter hormaechei]